MRPQRLMKTDASCRSSARALRINASRGRTGGTLYVKHSLTLEIVHAMDKQASSYNSEYKLTQTGNQFSTWVQPMLYMYANSTSTIYDCFKMCPSFWGGYKRDKKGTIQCIHWHLIYVSVLTLRASLHSYSKSVNTTVNNNTKTGSPEYNFHTRSMA